MFLANFAACLLKGAEHMAPILEFGLRGIDISLNAIRQYSPPGMLRIDYEIVIDTDESGQRLDLMHRNQGKCGMILNALSETTELIGAIRRIDPTDATPKSSHR